MEIEFENETDIDITTENDDYKDFMESYEKVRRVLSSYLHRNIYIYRCGPVAYVVTSI